MIAIDYGYFYEYVGNMILNETASMHESGQIKDEFKYKLFRSSGDYITGLDDPEYDSKHVILGNIANGGGVQDADLSIDAYLQIVTVELLAFENQRDDLVKVLTDLTANHKTVIDTIGGAACNLSISDFPEYSEKFNAHGHEKFTASFTIDIIVFPTARLSNSYRISILGSNVKYNTLVMSRTTETMSDLKKRDESKFFPNTTGFQIGIQGIYENTPALETLFRDCIGNSHFNQGYGIQLYDSDGNAIMNDSFLCKDSKFTFAYGKVVSYELTFYKKVEV